MANHAFTFPTVNEALPALAKELLEQGAEVGSRLGERTMELTQVAIHLEQPQHRYVTTPGRRANLAAQIVETAWMLSGRRDIATLLPYLPRAADFSDDGTTWRGAYGPRLRAWDGAEHDGMAGTRVDQLQHVVDLMSVDRSTRRAVMAIYDPRSDIEPDGKDVPCNDFVTLLSRNGALEMHVTVRSNDLWWGWSGINVFEWSTLQEILAHVLGVAVGGLHFSTSSLHLYDRHWERARDAVGKHERLEQWPPSSSKFAMSPAFNLHGGAFNLHAGTLTAPQRLDRLDMLLVRFWALESVLREGHLTNDHVQEIDAFPEPMLRSWLHALGYYWTGLNDWIKPYEGTSLHAAALATPGGKNVSGTHLHTKSSVRWRTERAPITSPYASTPTFLRFAQDLHAEKSAAYGDSWRKRGELLSILANIARKVDRLGAGTTADETSADTAVDLAIYLVKYWLWLEQHPSGPAKADDPRQISSVLDHVQRRTADYTTNEEPTVAWLKDRFEDLQQLAENRAPLEQRMALASSMGDKAWGLARTLWEREQEQQQSAEGERIDAWKAGNATRRWDPEHGIDDGADI